VRRLLRLPVQPTVVSGWQAWDTLADDPRAVLVDLGSTGSPDLRELCKVPLRGDARPVDRTAPVFLLSQTGKTAREVAADWLADGYAGVAVVWEGAAGWQALGLPWTQPAQAQMAQQEGEAGEHEKLVDEPVGGPDRPVGRVQE
jgi:hypothetical protein